MTTKNQTRIRQDLDQRTLTIARRFNAPRARVWRAYTEPALLDQWWAPKPWQAETQRMDFRVGGQWLYAMKGPEGEVHYGRVPAYSVVVPGALPGKDGGPSLACAVIVKRVDERTRSKTSINELLRD